MRYLELAQSHVTVALSGDGGDEAFGGYDRYRRLERQNAYQLGGLTRTAARVGARIARRDPFTRPAGRLALLSLSEQDRFALLVSHFTPGQLDALFSAEFRGWTRPTPWENVLGVPTDGTIQRFLDLDSVTYLPGAILTKVDRASMALGLEVRAPFMDFRVHEFAGGLPPSWKVSRRDTKILLRSLAARRGLPPSIVSRRKRGFSMPLGTWFRGPLREDGRRTYC